MTRAEPPDFYGTKTVAQWLGVPAHCVANWLRRYDDYPEPAGRIKCPDRSFPFWRDDQRRDWLLWAYSKDVAVLAAKPDDVAVHLREKG